MTMIIDGTNGLTFNNSTVQASAGNVLQVVQGTLTSQVSISSSSDTDVGLTATITPKFSTSKILVMASVIVQVNGAPSANTTAGWQVKTSGGTIVLGGTLFSQGSFLATGSFYNINGTQSKQILLSPATTSAITYKITGRTNGASSIVFNYTESGDFPVSTITLMEIAA